MQIEAPGDGRSAGRLRRVAGGLGLAAASMLVCLVALEIALQIASLFVAGRDDPVRPGAVHRILSVGDSHTFGGGVRASDAYPAQLQRFLDERAPKRFSVVNLGVPGANSTQVRNRLPVHVGLYEPSMIIVWAGVNNSWNVSEVGEASGRFVFLDGLASRSRLYRLVRVRIHDLRLERALEDTTGRPRPKLDLEELPEGSTKSPDTTMVRHGRRDLYRMEGRKPTVDEAMEEIAVRDFLAMSEFARASGIEILFVAYPMDGSNFGAANRAVRRVAAMTGATVVEASEGVLRLPPEKRKYMWAGHPTAPIYREVARDLAPHVLALDR